LSFSCLHGERRASFFDLYLFHSPYLALTRMFSLGRRICSSAVVRVRNLSSSASVTELESKINSILEAELKPSKLEVKDTSGGCGAMFDIKVSSAMFAGQSLVAQHKMVTNAIKAEIKEIHGLTLKTTAVKP